MNSNTSGFDSWGLFSGVHFKKSNCICFRGTSGLALPNIILACMSPVPNLALFVTLLVMSVKNDCDPHEEIVEMETSNFPGTGVSIINCTPGWRPNQFLVISEGFTVVKAHHASEPGSTNCSTEYSLSGCVLCKTNKYSCRRFFRPGKKQLFRNRLCLSIFTSNSWNAKIH